MHLVEIARDPRPDVDLIDGLEAPDEVVRSTMSFTTGFATVTGGGACAGPPWAKARPPAAIHENRTLRINTDRGKRMRYLLIGIVNAALYFQILAYGPVRRST